MAIRIPQVKEAGLPTTTGVRTPGADAFGAGVGQAVQGAGGKLFDIGLKMQNEANEAKARETDTYYTRKVNDLKNGYAQQTGKTAYESQQDYDKALADLKREAMSLLDNDAQKSMLAPLLDRKETEALDFGSKHAIKALKEWQVGELTAQAAMHTEAAVAGYGSEQGSIAIASLMENIEDLGDKNGWAPDVVENEKAKAMSKVLATRIQQDLATDPYAAEALFFHGQETGELLPSDAAGLANRVQGEIDKQRAMDLTDKFIADTGGDYQAAYEMSKQIENRDQRLEVQRLIKNDMAMKETFEREAKKDLHKAEWDKLYAIENPTLRDLPAPGTVDPEVRASMETYIDRKISRDRRIHNDDVLANDLTNMASDDPAAFQKEDLNKYRERLDPGTMSRLERLQAGDEKETQVNVERSEMRRRAYTLADIGKKDADGQVALATALDKALQAAQEAKGRKLDPRELDEVIKQEVYQYKTRVYRESSGFLGFGIEGHNLNDAIDQGIFKDSRGNPWSEQDVTEMVKRMDKDGQDLSIENVQRQLDFAEKNYSKK